MRLLPLVLLSLAVGSTAVASAPAREGAPPPPQTQEALAKALSVTPALPPDAPVLEEDVPEPWPGARKGAVLPYAGGPIPSAPGWSRRISARTPGGAR